MCVCFLIGNEQKSHSMEMSMLNELAIFLYKLCNNVLLLIILCISKVFSNGQSDSCMLSCYNDPERQVRINNNESVRE